jgi:hypothetical protein
MQLKSRKWTLFAAVGLLGLPNIFGDTASAASATPKITVSFVGDCASSPTAAIVTDQTTACSLQVSVKPAKRYRNLQVIRRCVYPEPAGTCFPDRYAALKAGKTKLAMGYAIAFADLGYFSTNSKGVATVPVLREYDGCVIKGGKDNLVVEWTNAKMRGGSFTQVASSNRTTLAFNVTWPAPNVPISGCATFLVGG